jgi:hypothetical protein
LFAGAVCTGDTIQIDLNGVSGWPTLGDCLGQTFCHFPDQLPA